MSPLLHTELYEACAEGRVERLRELLDADPDLDFDALEDGVSPLGATIAFRHEDCFRVLLAAGSEPNAPAGRDQPALFVAVDCKQTSMVVELVKAGAALDFCHPTLGSALSLAIVRRDAATANALLDAGIPVGLRNRSGATELHMAAFCGERALVERILERGADIDTATSVGGTPLRAAAHAGHADIVQLFLDRGANPATLDAFGNRPVFYAREGAHDAVVKLLENAASPTAPPRAWFTENALSSMLPARTDAVLKLVAEAREAGQSMLTAATSSLEAPSAIAVARAIAGPDFALTFPVGEPPDPRLPEHPVHFVLWSYEDAGKLGVEARPAVPEPSQWIVTLVARLAGYPYLLSEWSTVAGYIARLIDPMYLDEVAAAMVHPPPRPTYFELDDWCFRVQVAAALIVSRLGGEPWEEEPPRTFLESIAFGPADWSNTAAIIALLDVARRDEHARASVIDALVRVTRRALSPAVYAHAVTPAVMALREIPGVDANVLREAESRLVESRDTPSPLSSP